MLRRAIETFRKRYRTPQEFPPTAAESQYRVKACLTDESYGRLGALEEFSIAEATPVRWEGPLKFSEPKDNLKSKYSEGYGDCIGVALTAEDMDGKQISLLSHQMIPRYDYDNPNLRDQKKYIENCLRDFLSRAKPETVDAVFFGGLASTREQFDNYVKAIESTAKILRKYVRFEPTIIAAPTVGHQTGMSIALDNERKRMWIVRRQAQSFELREPLLASKVREMGEIWNTLGDTRKNGIL